MKTIDPIKEQWNIWLQLTRSYNCLLLAAEFERQRWQSINLLDKNKTTFYADHKPGSFIISIATYLSVLEDLSLPLGGLLIQYFSLFETHCSLLIGKFASTSNAARERVLSEFAKGDAEVAALTSDEVGEWVIRYKPIEQYANFIVTANSVLLKEPCSSIARLVEIAVFRHAIAHCRGVLSSSMSNRLHSVGLTKYGEGQSIKIDIDTLRRCVASMKTFLRLCEAKPRVKKSKPVPLEKTNRPIKKPR